VGRYIYKLPVALKKGPTKIALSAAFVGPLLANRADSSRGINCSDSKGLIPEAERRGGLPVLYLQETASSVTLV